MPTISVVIPVYNSQESLRELVVRLERVLSMISSDFEVVIVDDASRDNSWEAAGELALEFAWLRSIKLMRNYGQHNALLCGIRAARHEIIVTIDDDLQNPPEEMTKLLEKINEGYDVVYGTPEREQHGFFRDIASRVTKLALQSAMGSETARKVSAFRAFRSQVREAFAFYQSPFVSIDVLLTWGTTRFAAVSVDHQPRRLGVSNYTFRKLMTHALNMMTGFSTVPLQLSSLIGFALTLFGAAIFVTVVARFLIEGGSVPGFPFLASIVAIFSGAQLFALGIMGEYMARMHFRIMKKPPYVVREVLNILHPAVAVREQELK